MCCSEKKYFVIDRFEDDVAVCEEYEAENDEKIKMHSLKRSLLPSFLHEGDVISIEHENIQYEHELTEERRKKAKRKLISLFDN